MDSYACPRCGNAHLLSNQVSERVAVFGCPSCRITFTVQLDAFDPELRQRLARVRKQSSGQADTP